MNSKRQRSHSPVEYKEGRDKDHETYGRKDNSRGLEDSSDAGLGRGHESGRHSDRYSHGTSRESKRHDDYRRYHDKYDDDYGRNHPRSSRSDRESRGDYDRSKRDSTSGRSRGGMRDVDSRYGEKSFDRDQKSINVGKHEAYDGGEYNKCTYARKQEHRGYGHDRDHYRIIGKNKETVKEDGKNKETVKEEEVLKKRNGKEIEKEALVETREKKRGLFSSTGPTVDNPGDAKPSSATKEPLDSSAVSLDGVNAAKVAAMKAAELVNRNIAAFGAGTGRLSTDQKKKLLWGNKKSNPSEETSKRWDSNLFSDRERQEKFNKLMSLRMPWWLWPIAGCEEQRSSSGKHGGEHGRELGGSQETGGARHQPGEALHSRSPPKRWPDRRPWPLENLLDDAAALKLSRGCYVQSSVTCFLLLHYVACVAGLSCASSKTSMLINTGFPSGNSKFMFFLHSNWS